jgi:hypothetical protein
VHIFKTLKSIRFCHFCAATNINWFESKLGTIRRAQHYLHLDSFCRFFWNFIMPISNFKVRRDMLVLQKSTPWIRRNLYLINPLPQVDQSAFGGDFKDFDLRGIKFTLIHVNPHQSWPNWTRQRNKVWRLIQILNLVETGMKSWQN